MHVIKPHETAVTLFGRDGGVWVYPSKKAALAALGANWISRNVGAHFCECDGRAPVWAEAESRVDWRPWYSYHEFVMRDDFGQPLTWSNFSELQPRCTYWRYRYLDNWNGEGPVPGIHGRRHYRYFRRPGTTPERRISFAIAEDGEPAPRAARNATNLPNSYDDIGRSNVECRNWKRFRKQQWRG